MGVMSFSYDIIIIIIMMLFETYRGCCLSLSNETSCEPPSFSRSI